MYKRRLRANGQPDDVMTQRGYGRCFRPGRGLVSDGIPYAFAVEEVKAEDERLRALGVRFTQEPAEMGPTTTAVLDDTCGNLIQIVSTDDRSQDRDPHW